MKDNFENIFEEFRGNFDFDEPKSGHETRFVEKIKDSSKDKQNKTALWKPFLAIAATVIICLGIFRFSSFEEEKTGLASVSEEMSEAQDFFTATINEELKKLNTERSPLTEHIIYEAERQLKALEEDYKSLKNDLKQSGNDKRVIYAMIANYQSRIDILTNILDQIEDLKETNYDTEQTL